VIDAAVETVLAFDSACDIAKALQLIPVEIAAERVLP
jgi:hypothetical protein